MAAAKTPVLALRRWKRVEYERLVELGVFASDERGPLDWSWPRFDAPSARAG
jgi:hypothetical protein